MLKFQFRIAAIGFYNFHKQFPFILYANYKFNLHRIEAKKMKTFL